MILVPFYLQEDARIWAQWNYSLDMHLRYLGPYPEHRVLPVFLCPESPRGVPSVGVGVLQWLTAWSLFTGMTGSIPCPQRWTLSCSKQSFWETAFSPLLKTLKKIYLFDYFGSWLPHVNSWLHLWDQSQLPALGVWHLNHWTTREVPKIFFFFGNCI